MFQFFVFVCLAFVLQLRAIQLDIESVYSDVLPFKLQVLNDRRYIGAEEYCITIWYRPTHLNNPFIQESDTPIEIMRLSSLQSYNPSNPLGQSTLVIFYNNNLKQIQFVTNNNTPPLYETNDIRIVQYLLQDGQWYFFYLGHNGAINKSIMHVFNLYNGQVYSEEKYNINLALEGTFTFTVGSISGFQSPQGQIFNPQISIEQGVYTTDKDDIINIQAVKTPNLNRVVGNYLLLSEQVSGNYNNQLALNSDFSEYTFFGSFFYSTSPIAYDIVIVAESELNIPMFKILYDPNSSEMRVIYYERKFSVGTLDQKIIDIPGIFISQWYQFHVSLSGNLRLFSIELSCSTCVPFYLTKSDVNLYNQFRPYLTINNNNGLFNAKNVGFSFGEGSYSKYSKLIYKDLFSASQQNSEEIYLSKSATDSANYGISFWFRFLRHSPVEDPSVQQYPYNILTVFDQGVQHLSFTASETNFILSGYGESATIDFPAGTNPFRDSESEWIFGYISVDFLYKFALFAVRYHSDGNLLYKYIMYSSKLTPSISVPTTLTICRGSISNIGLTGFNGQILMLRPSHVAESSASYLDQLYPNDDPALLTLNQGNTPYHYQLLYNKYREYFGSNSEPAIRYRTYHFNTLDINSYSVGGWTKRLTSTATPEFILRISPLKSPSSSSSADATNLLIQYAYVAGSHVIQFQTVNLDIPLTKQCQLTPIEVNDWVYIYAHYSKSSSIFYIECQPVTASSPYSDSKSSFKQFNMPIAHVFFLQDDGQAFSGNLNVGYFQFIVNNELNLVQSAKDQYGTHVSCKAGSFLENSCTSCYPSSILQNGYCTQCKLLSGYYLDSSGVCVICADPLSYSCKDITGDTELCIVQEMFFGVTGKCLCPAGKFIQNSGGVITCEACSLNCLTCSNSSDFCETCDQARHAYLDTSDFICVCEDGYYLDSNQVCQPCDPTCMKCQISASQCISCFPNQIRTLNIVTNKCECSSTQCYTDSSTLGCKDIKPHEFLVGDSQCSECSSKCKKCTNSSTNCTECIVNQNRSLNVGTGVCECNPGFMEVNGSDMCTECPANTFNQGNQCIPCHHSCTECIGSADSSCTACNQTTRFYNVVTSKCECKSGLWDNPSNQNCEPCSQTCKSCSNANTCDTCFTNMHKSTSTQLCECNNQSLGYSKQFHCVLKGHNLQMKSYKTINTYTITFPFKFSEKINASPSTFQSNVQISVQDIPNTTFKTLVKTEDQTLYNIEISFTTNFQDKIATFTFLDYSLFSSQSGLQITETEYSFNQTIKTILYLEEDSTEGKQAKSIKEFSDNMTNQDAFLSNFLEAFDSLSVIIFLVNAVQLSLIFLSINTVLPVNFYYILKVFAKTVVPYVADWQTPDTEYVMMDYGVAVKNSNYQGNIGYTFQRLNLTNVMLVSVSFAVIRMIAIVLLVYTACLVLVNHLMQYKKIEIIEFFQKLSERSFNFLLGLTESNFFILTIAIFISIKYYEDIDTFSAGSLAMSLITVCFLVGITIICYQRLKKRYYWLKQKNMLERLRLFSSIQNSNFEDFMAVPIKLPNEAEIEHFTKDLTKSEKVIYFHAFGFLKKLLFSVLIVFANPSPQTQIILLSLIQFTFVVYTIIIRPFSSKLILYIRVTADCAFTICLILIVFSEIEYERIFEGDPNQIQSGAIEAYFKLGTAQIIMFAIFIFIHLAVFLIGIFEVLKGVWRDLNKPKPEIISEKEEDIIMVSHSLH